MSFTDGIGNYLADYTGSMSQLLEEGWGFSASLWDMLQKGFELQDFFSGAIPVYLWISLSIIVGFAYTKSVMSLLPF